MKLLRKILIPFVPVYFLVTWFRNKLYDLGLKKSKSYSFPVICIGNLSVGGTGKTPMVEYLIRLLKEDFKVATLSRGYKRKSKGFLLADETATANTLGDEPFQFYSKYKSEVMVAVDENRINGINALIKQTNSPEIILLDDAYQHRKVKAGFNILLTPYQELYTRDILLPTGNLREPRSGADRADVVIVTKCPDCISKSEKQKIQTELSLKPQQTLFFSTIDYDINLLGSNDSLKLKALKNFTLVTGIANPEPLTNYLENLGKTFEHLNFKDHHNFSEADIKNLSSKGCILTTEKDFMRLKQYEVLKSKLYYIPIRAKIDCKKEFNQLIKSFVESF